MHPFVSLDTPSPPKNARPLAGQCCTVHETNDGARRQHTTTTRQRSAPNSCQRLACNAKRAPVGARLALLRLDDLGQDVGTLDGDAHQGPHQRPLEEGLAQPLLQRVAPHLRMRSSTRSQGRALARLLCQRGRRTCARGHLSASPCLTGLLHSGTLPHALSKAWPARTDRLDTRFPQGAGGLVTYD